ncbi:MAG: hypothetical protein AAGI51_03345 [Pseudomonadota bacterium]
MLRLTLDRPRDCADGSGYGRKETLIDLRVLETNRADVRISDHSARAREAISGGVGYAYRSSYDRGLSRAYARRSRILDEGFDRYPTDVPSRLAWFSDAFREGIDPELYARSKNTTWFCSGAEIAEPLGNGLFTLFLPLTQADELADLIETQAETCEAAAAS